VVVERSRDHHKQDKQTRRRGDDIADCGFWISNFGLRIEDEETSKMGQEDKGTGGQGEKSRKNSGGRAKPRSPYSKRQGDDMSSEKEKEREGEVRSKK
jgi:hypothetical protein